MVGELELKVLNGIFQLAGTFFASQIGSDGGDERKKISDAYYKKVSKIIENDKDSGGRKNEKLKKLEQTLEKDLKPMMEKLEKQSRPRSYEESGDLTEEKTLKGTGCLRCSGEHIGQAAALLKEAVRFAVRGKGLADPEVEERVHDALLELNALERKDLTPEKIEKMNSEEKELAIFYMNKSSDIRHKLNNIKTPDDLIAVSSFAISISKDLHKRVWAMSVDTGTIEKLCEKTGMTASERQTCMEAVQGALDTE